jgi:exosortase/archaeosortase family protein
LSIDGYTLRGHRFYNEFPARSVVSIVWSCSGMKQLFIFTTMLLFYPYGCKHKLWAIPVFGIIILALNLVRLMVLLYHTQHVPADFDLWHEGSKYVFYAIMFGIWILWEDIVKKYAPRN